MPETSLREGEFPSNPPNLRSAPVIGATILCVSLLVGSLVLMIYYSDKQHAIARTDRQRIIDKEARVEGTIYGQGMILERVQRRLDYLERRVDRIVEKVPIPEIPEENR